MEVMDVSGPSGLEVPGGNVGVALAIDGAAGAGWDVLGSGAGVGDVPTATGSGMATAPAWVGPLVRTVF